MGYQKGNLYKAGVPNRLAWYEATGSGYPGEPNPSALAGDTHVPETRAFTSPTMQGGTYKIWVSYAYCNNIDGEWATFPDDAEVVIPDSGKIKKGARSPKPSVACLPGRGDLRNDDDVPEEYQ